MPFIVSIRFFLLALPYAGLQEARQVKGDEDLSLRGAVRNPDRPSEARQGYSDSTGSR
jgi:hypothetical protein